MRKILIGLFIIVVVGIIIVLPKQEGSTSSENVVKIGVSLPLTGPVNLMGQASKESIKLAFDKWQEKGTKYNYELIMENNEYDGKRTASIANKFVNVDNVKAHFSILSQGQLASKSHTELKSVINMGCAWGSEAQQGKFNLNNSTHPKTLANKMVEGLLKHDIKTVVLLVNSTAGAMEVNAALKDSLSLNGIEVLHEEVVPVGTKDYALVLGKMISKRPDIIISQAVPNDFKLFMYEYQKQSAKIPVTAMENFTAIEDKAILNDMWFLKMVKEADFSQELQDDVFSQYCASNMYDNMDMLIHAFENVETKNELPTTTEVMDYIISLGVWDGATGESKIYADGTIDTEPYLAIIRDGKVEKLEE